MRISVAFQDERLEFEVEADRLIGHWDGPSVPSADNPRAITRLAIEAPREFPPLLKAVVPGDRVVIPLDPALPDPSSILDVVAEQLRQAEVDSITVVTTAPAPPEVPEGVDWQIHDPDDKTQIAYLATTQDGQRVYLNRLVTDADLVLPIGALGYDATLGYRGPWSAIYPSLSDRETQARYRAQAVEELPDREHPRASLKESSEVSWLLGCQFHVGVLPGASGTAEVVSGLESAVLTDGAVAVDKAWSFQVEDRADVVIAGIGAPGQPTTFAQLADGLATAARLVRRGGKIVALSTTEGKPGKAVRRLTGLENPRAALPRLRGLEAEPDYPAAKLLAVALAWADVYLYSKLEPDLVDDLAMIPLDRPEEARKLAASAASCILISQADRVRARVDGE